MKTRILEYYNTFGNKQYILKIKKDVELFSYIENYKNEHNLVTNTLSEVCYLIVNSDFDPICKVSGRKKTFISFTEGYKDFCGKMVDCECCRIIAGKKVSQAKLSKSDEHKQEINRKMEETFKQRYGVVNPGQINIGQKYILENGKELEIIRDMINKSGKTNYCKFIKQNEEIYNWIIKNTSHLPIDSELNERIFQLFKGEFEWIK